jgi:hypothetical protein
MRIVFLTGAAMAVVFIVLARVIALLNGPSDQSVAAGYFLLLALVSIATGVTSWLLRRRL